jgi:hypothetical protein
MNRNEDCEKVKGQTGSENACYYSVVKLVTPSAFQKTQDQK